MATLLNESLAVNFMAPWRATGHSTGSQQSARSQRALSLSTVPLPDRNPNFSAAGFLIRNTSQVFLFVLCCGLATFASTQPDNFPTFIDGPVLDLDTPADGNADDENLQFVHVDGQNWLAVWIKETTYARGSDPFLARSSDGGVTWSFPEPVFPEGLGPYFGVEGVAVLKTPTGQLLMAINYHDFQIGHAILYTRSWDGGITWSDPETVTSYPTDQSAILAVPPVMLQHPDGTILLVWVGYYDLGGSMNGDRDLHFVRSTDEGANWSDVATINTDAAIDEGGDVFPALTVTNEGNFVAVWSKHGGAFGEDSDIFSARSSDGGVSWSSFVPVASWAADGDESDIWPSVATLDDGRLLVVWQSMRDINGSGDDVPDIVGSYSADGGITWSEPVEMITQADESFEEYDPVLHRTGPGAWMIGWHGLDVPNRGGDYRVYVNRSADDGKTWLAPQEIRSSLKPPPDPDSHNSGLQSPVFAQFGTELLIGWETNSDWGTLLYRDADLVFAKSTDSGRTFTDVSPLNGDAWTLNSGRDTYPGIATDHQRAWVAIWDSTDNPRGWYGFDHDLFISRSLDDGVNWEPVRPLFDNIGEDSGEEVEAAVANDRNGKWMVVWQGNSPLGPDNDIYFSLSSDKGATWTIPAPVNPGASTDGPEYHDQKPVIIALKKDTWMVAWVSGDNDFAFTQTSDNGATWDDVRNINDSSFPVHTVTAGESHQIYLNNDGSISAIWYARDFSVRMTRSLDGGDTWSSATIIPTSGSGRTYGIGTNQEGKWIASWKTTVVANRQEGEHSRLGGIPPPIDEEVTYFAATSFDYGQTWGAAEIVTSYITPYPNRFQPMSVVTDRRGRWVLTDTRFTTAWVSFDDGDTWQRRSDSNYSPFSNVVSDNGTWIQIDSVAGYDNHIVRGTPQSWGAAPSEFFISGGGAILLW